MKYSTVQLTSTELKQYCTIQTLQVLILQILLTLGNVIFSQNAKLSTAHTVCMVAILVALILNHQKVPIITEFQKLFTFLTRSFFLNFDFHGEKSTFLSSVDGINFRFPAFLPLTELEMTNLNIDPTFPTGIAHPIYTPLWSAFLCC